MTNIFTPMTFPIGLKCILFSLFVLLLLFLFFSFLSYLSLLFLPLTLPFSPLPHALPSYSSFFLSYFTPFFLFFLSLSYSSFLSPFLISFSPFRSLLKIWIPKRIYKLIENEKIIKKKKKSRIDLQT